MKEQITNLRIKIDGLSQLTKELRPVTIYGVGIVAAPEFGTNMTRVGFTEPIKWKDEFFQRKQIIYNDMTMENVNFGTALEAVKQGKRIAREGWNGKGMFVFQRPEDSLPLGFVVEKVKSLPDSVKKWLGENANMDEPVNFTAYLCMKAVDGTIVNGWLASQTDMLANDWCILD